RGILRAGTRPLRKSWTSQTDNGTVAHRNTGREIQNQPEEDVRPIPSHNHQRARHVQGTSMRNRTTGQATAHGDVGRNLPCPTTDNQQGSPERPTASTASRTDGTAAKTLGGHLRTLR